MTRDEWSEIERILGKDTVRLAMRGRCEEQGHDWESCCSVVFQIYQQCKWCGATR